MRRWLPIHRPLVGVSVTERDLTLVELRRRGPMPIIARLSRRPLPDGLCRLSPTELNVSNPDGLSKELRALMAGVSARAIAVCLPDRICHLAVFQFETLPARERDREPILRWRFQHDEHVAVGDAQILHRVFPDGDRMPVLTNGAKPGTQGASVLALAIKGTVLDQYVRICEQAGMLPVSIGCAALWLFEFYRTRMAQADELFLAHQAADSLTVVAIRRGVPVFSRTKPGPYVPAISMREIQSTVQYYEDLFPHDGEAVDSPAFVPLYLLGECCSDSEALGQGTTWPEFQTFGKRLVRVLRPPAPDWKVMMPSERSVTFHEGGLCALACAVGG